MKLFCLLGFLGVCMPLAASSAERIAPGMKLDAVKRTLHRHGYEVSEKYVLAMDTTEERALEFCRIDDDIIMVLNYNRHTKEVQSLSLVLFPEDQTSKMNIIDLSILEMRFEGDGFYTVKMRRKGDSERKGK